MNAQNHRAILYYPTIKIESKKWLKQTLLYWDVIGTIVPYNLQRRADRVREFRELIDNDMLRFYHPERYLQEGEQLSDEFIRLRSSSKYQSLYRKQKVSSNRFEVHDGKIPNKLRTYLRENRLTKPGQDGSVSLTRLDGLLFMSLLAKYIADEDDRLATTPGTDYRAYQDLAFLVGAKEDHMPVLTLTLEQILPTPREDATLAQVIEFKRKRHFELLHFRQVIDEIESALKNVTSSGELQHLIAHYSERIKVEVELIDQLFKDAKMTTTYATLENIMSIGQPALLSQLLTGIPHATPLILASTGLYGAIKLRKQYIDATNSRRQILMARSYSYLYLAHKEGILNKP